MNESTIETLGAKALVRAQEADDAMAAFELAMVGYFPPGLRCPSLTEMGMYDSVDPLDLPLPKPVQPDWVIKDRSIEWVLHNFTDDMLAKLYKMIYNRKTKTGTSFRIDSVDEIIKKG